MLPLWSCKSQTGPQKDSRTRAHTHVPPGGFSCLVGLMDLSVFPLKGSCLSITMYLLCNLSSSVCLCVSVCVKPSRKTFIMSRGRLVCVVFGVEPVCFLCVLLENKPERLQTSLSFTHSHSHNSTMVALLLGHGTPLKWLNSFCAIYWTVIVKHFFTSVHFQ